MVTGNRAQGVRPRGGIGRQLDLSWRYAFPTVSGVALILLSLAPFGLWGQSALPPTLALTCVWFWSLFRPAAMNPPVTFLIGLLLDLVAYLPPGVGPVTMLVTSAAAGWSRRFLSNQIFSVVWVCFIGLAFSVAALNWILVSLLTARLMAFGPVLFEAGLAAGLYPVVAIPLMLAHHTIADPDRA